MNLLDTVAVTSRSFSKNEGLANALKAKYSKVIFNDSGVTLQRQDLINFLSPADKAIIGIEEISAEVLNRADILSIHLPILPETENIISLELIKRSPLNKLEIRSHQNLNAKITEHREELVKKLMRAIGW